MNKQFSVKLLLPVLVLLLGSCIRDHIQDCPPLQVTLTVKDKNYFNIDDAVKLGLAERKDENLPFREYVQTLYYRVTDEAGRIVAEQKTMPVTNDAMTEEIVLPVSLPYGRYTVSVWGNLQSDEPLDEGASQADLEAAGAARNDIYLASATFDYQYGAELYTLGLERTKGNLLIKAEGIPDNINFSMKTIDDIFSTVTSDFEYSNLTQVSTELEWEVRNEILSETLLCPSPGYEGSTLSVTFVDHDAVSGIAGRATETASVLTPEDVNITMGRNEITILKYVYDAQQEDFKIYVRVNDNWEQWHGMELD